MATLSTGRSSHLKRVFKETGRYQSKRRILRDMQLRYNGIYEWDNTNRSNVTQHGGWWHRVCTFSASQRRKYFSKNYRIAGLTGTITVKTHSK